MKLANHVLSTPYPQAEQLEATGIPWSIVEDWFDAGPLDAGDNKIFGNYNGRASIQTIKKHVKFSKREKAVETWKLLVQSQWFNYMSRALAVNVGGIVKADNKKHDTDLFNAQTLLWPGEESRDWILQFKGAREEVMAQRQYIMHRIFGPDWETAKRKMNRMLNPTFELLTFLRGRFDPQYLQGELGHTPRSDLTHYEYDDEEVSLYDLAGLRTQQEMKELYAFLATTRPTLLEEGADVQGKRVARIAFHTDRDGFKQDVLDGRQSRVSRQSAVEKLDYVLTRKGTYSRRLVDLRMLHTLSQTTIDKYRELVHTLGYNGTEPIQHNNEFAERIASEKTNQVVVNQAT